MAEPILDLTTPTAQKPKIRIDGKLYPLKDINELSLSDYLLLGRQQSLYQRMLKGVDALDEKDTKALESTIGLLTCRVLEKVPEKVVAKLTEIQKLRILQAVFTQPGDSPKSLPANSKLSPDSNGSTEETQPNG